MDLLRVFPRPAALLGALVLIGGAVLLLEHPWAPGSSVPSPPDDIPAHLLGYPAAADFRGATGWLQSEPLDLVALRGNVTLVDFWTYSCINCIRTFPHVRGWWETYRDHGLVVVGVHTPEFRFEREAANVLAAARAHNLSYPVAQDNDYGVWQAYHNRYWPAKYLVDAWGRIRYTHFGEGAYAETEQQIRALLREAGRTDLPPPSEGGETAARVQGLTPELYAAAAQGPSRVSLGNPEGYHPGRTITYARPAEVPRDRILLVGPWANHDENVTAAGEAGVLVRFRAGAANFVATGAEGACIPLLLDDAPLAPSLAGPDARPAPASCVPLDGPRAYRFYRGPVGEHLLELRVPEGFALFAFAFSPDGGS